MTTSEEAIHALDTLVEAYGVAIRAIRAQIDVKGVEIDHLQRNMIYLHRMSGEL